MKLLKYALSFFILILVSLIWLILIDIFLFSGGMWVVKYSVQILRNWQTTVAHDRGEEYAVFFSNNIELFKRLENGLDVDSVSAHSVKDISIAETNCEKQVCDFRGKNGYIIRYEKEHHTALWDIKIPPVWIVVKILSKDWYVLAPCNRLICSESEVGYK